MTHKYATPSTKKLFIMLKDETETRPFINTSGFEDWLHFVTDTGERVIALWHEAGTWSVHTRQDGEYRRVSIVWGKADDTPLIVWQEHLAKLKSNDDFARKIGAIE